MPNYAIIKNSTNQVINLVNSDRSPEFLTGSDTYYVDVSNHQPYPSIYNKYHQSSDKFILRPSYYLSYVDGETDNILFIDPLEKQLLDSPIISGSLNLTASWSSDLVGCDSGIWDVTNGTISNYRFDNNTEKSTFTLICNNDLNDGDPITIKIDQTVTDTTGFVWNVGEINTFTYTSSIT